MRNHINLNLKLTLQRAAKTGQQLQPHLISVFIIFMLWINIRGASIDWMWTFEPTGSYWSGDLKKDYTLYSVSAALVVIQIIYTLMSSFVGAAFLNKITHESYNFFQSKTRFTYLLICGYIFGVPIFIAINRIATAANTNKVAATIALFSEFIIFYYTSVYLYKEVRLKKPKSQKWDVINVLFLILFLLSVTVIQIHLIDAHIIGDSAK